MDKIVNNRLMEHVIVILNNHYVLISLVLMVHVNGQLQQLLQEHVML